MDSYIITIGIFIAINSIVVSGLNIIVGYAGQISLGHAAFFGIGAYTAAILATKAWPANTLLWPCSSHQK